MEQLNFINEEGRTPLGEAIVNCNIKKVEKLLNKGADPNFTMKNNITPLHLVAMRYNKNVISETEPLLKIAKLLVKFGANTSAICIYENRECDPSDILGLNKTERNNVFLDFQLKEPVVIISSVSRKITKIEEVIASNFILLSILDKKAQYNSNNR